FGDRVEILNADLLDLDVEALGQFDLVYLNGVYYVAPPQVQARLLEVIGQVLRPGGVLLMSYYAGAIAELRGLLYRAFRSVTAPTDSPAAALEKARAHIPRLRAGIRDPLFGPPMRALLDAMETYPDNVFYLEALNGSFTPCRTSDLQARLGPHGVQFITYLDAPAATRAPTAEARALEADVEDYGGGGYRYSVFMRRAASGIVPDVRAPGVAWSNALVRSEPDGEGQAVFVDVARNLNFTIRSPLTVAFLAATCGQPLDWRRGLAAARLGDVAGPDPEVDEATLATDVGHLWRLGAVTPTRT
ncbi:MAG: class I SAM-dependent methyltransferase, partial [Proteobacteria bacterium]|nr:class I SAM-dependent methyltransferase [Pseudomonadota bacterium]